MNIKQLIFFLCVAAYAGATYATKQRHTYHFNKQSYSYTTAQTGINYNFEFDDYPVTNEREKLLAGQHVMQSIYRDKSIKRHYSEGYIRERARCFVFDSRFHTYTLCFLPNEFSSQKQERFWGFVTQMPNWKGLVTRFLFPAILAFSVFFFVTRKKPLKRNDTYDLK